MDAKEGGNETRYLNDWRGTGEVQNVSFVRVRCVDGCVSVKVVGEDAGVGERVRGGRRGKEKRGENEGCGRSQCEGDGH